MPKLTLEQELELEELKLRITRMEATLAEPDFGTRPEIQRIAFKNLHTRMLAELDSLIAQGSD